MRILLAATSVVLLALSGPAAAGPLRSCEQVSALVEAAIQPLLAGQTGPQFDASQLGKQVLACLRSHNICGVVDNSRGAKEALIAGDVTTDMPQRDLSVQGRPTVVLLLRSIPRVRNDANQYCLVSAQLAGAAPAPRWNVYGWVIAPNAREALPLQKQVLNDKGSSDPKSLRGLAAALWFFAERMSGQPPP